MDMSREPQDWAEVHSPTVEVENVVSHQGRLTKTAYRQREADYKLLTRLTHDELRAFVEIGKAVQWASLTRHVRSQMYERVDFGRPLDRETPYQHGVLQTFSDWARLVLSHEKVDYRAIIAIISEGYGVRQVDRDWRKASGWARRNLGLGLELWCDLRGWT